MKEKNKNNSNKTILIISILIIIICIIILFATNKNIIKEELTNEGYTTNESNDAFYKRITINNTIDSFYKSVENNENDSYLEYYFSKQSNDFIELKMDYYNGENTVLNITNSLNSSLITFDLEYTKENDYILLEGTYENEISCNIVKNRNTSSSKSKELCISIEEEIENFINEKNRLLQNEKLKNEINKN